MWDKKKWDSVKWLNGYHILPIPWTAHPLSDYCSLHHKSTIHCFTVSSHFTDFQSCHLGNWSPWQPLAERVFAWQPWLENVSHDVFCKTWDTGTVICFQFLKLLQNWLKFVLVNGFELQYHTENAPFPFQKNSKAPKKFFVEVSLCAGPRCLMSTVLWDCYLSPCSTAQSGMNLWVSMIFPSWCPPPPRISHTSLLLGRCAGEHPLLSESTVLNLTSGDSPPQKPGTSLFLAPNKRSILFFYSGNRACYWRTRTKNKWCLLPFRVWQEKHLPFFRKISSPKDRLRKLRGLFKLKRQWESTI